jgi:hypothetical protein
VTNAKIDDINMSQVTMTDVMSDDDDCDSEGSGAELRPQLDDEARLEEETTIDLSGEDAVPNGEGGPQVEALAAASTPRAYQLEMLEEPTMQYYCCCKLSAARRKLLLP